MSLRQWDIVTTKIWDKDHPVVVLTPTELLGQPFVNILACSTLYSGHEAAATEIILDEADGLQRRTVCKLAPIRLVDRADLGAVRGAVEVERQRQMGRKMIQLYGLWRP